MSVDRLPIGRIRFSDLDRLTKASVMAFLGQALNATRRGDDRAAIFYLGVAILAFKYKKISFAIQAVSTARRLFRRPTR